MRTHKVSMHMLLTNHGSPAAPHYRLWLAVATAPVGGQLRDRACLPAGVPLLFMTNMGADPSQELQEVAASLVGSDAYHQLAMGQGQTQPALDMLQACARSGELPHAASNASVHCSTKQGTAQAICHLPCYLKPDHDTGRDKVKVAVRDCMVNTGGTFRKQQLLHSQQHSKRTDTALSCCPCCVQRIACTTHGSMMHKYCAHAGWCDCTAKLNSEPVLGLFWGSMTHSSSQVQHACTLECQTGVKMQCVCMVDAQVC